MIRAFSRRGVHTQTTTWRPIRPRGDVARLSIILPIVFIVDPEAVENRAGAGKADAVRGAVEPLLVGVVFNFHATFYVPT